MKILSLFISILLIPIAVVGCASSNNYSYSFAASEYENLLKECETNNSLTNSEIYMKYSKLFHAISQGTQKERDDFANLLRKITNKSVDFQNNEVFALAAEYEKIFAGLADGSVEIGIQDLTIHSVSDQIILEIAYIDRIQYFTNELTKGELWYSDGKQLTYNNELGEYTFKVYFSDTELSKNFVEKYSLNTIHTVNLNIDNTQYALNFKITDHPEHGYVIYIGSQETIKINETPSKIINRPSGIIEISIQLGK